MIMLDQEKLQIELMSQWYSSDEINGIIEWIRDVEAWRVYTAEEVYQSLFKEEKVHA